MFKNRIQAGENLAEELLKFSNESCVVLGVPRGGIPVAFVVAQKLGVRLDLVLTKKIGHPINKEFAIGAASLEDYVLDSRNAVSEEYLNHELNKIRERLTVMKNKFKQNRKPVPLKDKTVIIVDDGMATGNTLLVTAQLIRKKNPKKIIIAVPVASDTSVDLLKKETDEVIALLVPYDFRAVGQFYEEFNQVSDEEVINYLDDFNCKIT